MSLMDAPPYDPAKDKRRTQIKITIAVAVVAALLGYGFYALFWPNIEAKHTVTNFMNALVRHNYQEAYYIWKPLPRVYTMDAFMDDWGPKSPWGEIKSYRIVEAGRPAGKTAPSGVVVLVEINGNPNAARLWVEKKSQIMSFYQF